MLEKNPRDFPSPSVRGATAGPSDCQTGPWVEARCTGTRAQGEAKTERVNAGARCVKYSLAVQQEASYSP